MEFRRVLFRSVEQAISEASKKVLEVVLIRALILSNLKLGRRTFVILLPILSPRQSSALVAKSVITISFFLVSGWERFVGIPTAMRFRDRSMGSFGPLPNHVPGQEARTEMRSEEHTSELQSLMRISYAVFCLKKKIKIHHT